MPEGMGEDRPGCATERRLQRRLMHLEANDDASAGVVAIMLAILMMITILTLVTTVWMPSWMEGIENDHAKEVSSQFNDIKSTIDKQILNGDTKFVMGNPITLGASGFSVFGSDSTGTFSINSFRDSDMEYYCNVKNQSGEVNITCTGGLKYRSNNINFVNQVLAYENGALILDQGKGEVVRVRPQFTVEKHGPVARMSFVLITVSGIEASITGTGTIIVQTQLVTYTSREFLHRDPQWVNTTIVTEFPHAWAMFFNNTLIEAGFTSGVDYITTVSGDRVVVAIKDVLQFNMGYALINVDIEDQVGGSSTSAALSDVVGLWHLNQNSGTSARDSSRYHNDGTTQGDTAWTTGMQGSGLHFNGTDAYVSVPEIPEYNMDEGVTVMLWLQWTVDPASGVPYATVVSKGENQWMVQHSGLAPPGPGINEFFEFAVRTNETRDWAWSTTMPVKDIWYHVTGVFDSTTHEIRLYVNGTLENTTLLNGTINIVNQDLTIGARLHSGAYDRYFEGTIDEVIIFDRALSTTEIFRYYQSLKP